MAARAAVERRRRRGACITLASWRRRTRHGRIWINRSSRGEARAAVSGYGGAGTRSVCYLTYLNQPVAVFWTPKRSPADIYIYMFSWAYTEVRKLYICEHFNRHLNSSYNCLANIEDDFAKFYSVFDSKYKPDCGIVLCRMGDGSKIDYFYFLYFQSAIIIICLNIYDLIRVNM